MPRAVVSLIQKLQFGFGNGAGMDWAVLTKEQYASSNPGFSWVNDLFVRFVPLRSLYTTLGLRFIYPERLRDFTATQEDKVASAKR